MTELTQSSTKQMDTFSASVLTISTVCALLLLFLFYAPGVDQALKAAQVPPGQGVWLHLHIASYCLSYTLFAAALLLAGARLVAKARTRHPWIEGAAGLGALLTIPGLVFGGLASKPMWGVYWVWDIKLILSIGATMALIPISLASIMTMRISSTRGRNRALALLLTLAMLVCAGLYLVGRAFGLTIHPQWFPELLLR
jgi:ABC-type transport system involved in cytochrome c biogenesis permease subunit